jgi:flagellar motor protein MotB
VVAAAPLPAGANAMTVAFDPGSSTMSATTAEAVKQVALHRRGLPIAITGYGDARSADPAAQEAALRLAVARASAVAAAMKAAGVPDSALQIGGEAAGRGVNIRLLQ